MTDRRDGSGDARAAFRRLPTPDHRPDFWDELEHRLETEPREGPSEEQPAVPPPPRPADPEGDGDEVIELPATAPVRRRPPRWLAAAALLVVVAVAATVVGIVTGDDDQRIDVADPPTTSAPAATSEPAPASTSIVVEPGADAQGAQDAALEWIDLLAAGDMAAAWERLGPTAQAGWGSYDEFEGARTDFAEGLGLWSTAERREVGAVTVIEFPDGGALHVVTLTGVRRPEGMEEDSAFALAVREEPDGTYLVEPPSPAGSEPVAFTTPVPDTVPAQIAADDPVVVSSEPGADLAVVIDRDGDVVPLDVDAAGQATYRPSDGWSAGRHVVTAVQVGDDGSPSAAAIALQVV